MQPGSHRGENPLIGPEAFERFYAQHSQGVVVFFSRRVLDSELALDLTAETFAQAFVSRRRFRGSTNAESAAWLFGIARHELSRYLRRGRAERRALTRLGIEVPEATAEDVARVEELADTSELRTAVAEGLALLRGPQREALCLRVVRELPYPEVAAALGCSEQTARARVSRGLKALAGVLDAHLKPQEMTP